MAEQVADHVSTRIECKLAQLPEAPSEPYIFKVDNPLRKENEQAYEPESLSIGPYHHGKDNLKVMEEHKWRYLKQLLQRRQETSVDRYIVALRDLEGRARKCYAETINFDKDKFVEIMLLDGCFIIELFRKYQKRELREKPDLIFQLNRVRYKLRRDLMLFENQLPLFILVQLFKMTEPSNSQDNIIDLALGFLTVMLPAGSKALESSTRISIEDDHKETRCHLLSLVHDSWCSEFSIMVSRRNVVPLKEELRFIKSTTELLDTGIKFKKAKKNKFLFDIEYKNGVLVVPPLTIDDNTEFIFRNLIAYEQYRHWGTDPKCHRALYYLEGIKMSEQTGDPISIRIDEDLAHLSSTICKPHIFIVPARLRLENEKAYEPEIVAIGPYHHGKENLEKMEKHKIWYLQQFLKRRNETSVDKYVMALRSLEKEARNCYAESTDQFDENKFVEMMLLDGCFIIELFQRASMGDSDPCDPVLDLVQVQESVGHDLMLFENQLPFFILVELLNMTDVVPATRGYLIKLAWTSLNQMLPSAPTPTYFEYSTISVDDVNHLLGLMHKVFCSSFAEMVPPRVTERNGGNPELEFIKCTTELRDAGIKFKILTESTSLLHIKFENGVLKIPPFIVDDNTEPIFRNLIAYEQYLPSIYRRYVTDYMIFMDRLVNSAKDAAKLRKYGIIDNWLGDDEVVSIMFNSIANKICINSTMFCYWKVFKNVNKYCGKRRNIWLAKLRRNYFNSPWAIISFLAAFTLLVLTFIQTGFSILSYVE
ncbi:hypothetical protein F0562_000258 [Nyssa sinensis]|uniref:Uncharacterized protein n=1 Tax=Nyssa sinensis TaxID=561372 RepID=A0A5J5BZF9_9ASTE|nr:hypothetical protein F0562_000258 [Nyssa sinensis]